MVQPINNYTVIDKKLLAGIFKQYAIECRTTPLYEHLSLKIADDPELLELAAFTKDKQPLPNMLFAAVHYLLLNDTQEELADFYPNLKITNRPIEEAFPIFKAFCEKQYDTIKHLIATRATQTNGINRCAYLVPVIASIAAKENKSVHLVEIGPSAGLNLWWEDYKIQYEKETTFVEYGASDSKVVLKTMLKGDFMPRLDQPVNIASRIGIDQNPVDLRQKDQADWLKALIWPNHTNRFGRMEAAVELACDRTQNFLIKGDTIPDFRAAIDSIPRDQLVIIYHTHVLYQFSQQERESFWQMLEEVSKERDFYYINAECTRTQRIKHETADTPVELVTYKNFQKTETLVAITNGHADWIQFIQENWNL